jgi:3-methyladenine DNA glycosylase AlkC
MAEIPPDLIARLNRGEAETVTLVEWLAIDTVALLRAVAPEAAAGAEPALQAETSVMKRSHLAARRLHEHFGDEAAARFANHPSDTVRGWAALIVGSLPRLTLRQRLARIRPAAADAHMAVREMAWLAVRPHLAADLPKAIRLLTPWTASEDASVRRFATESTRPRGVWCAHIEALKQRPELGLPLLEPLRADPSKYVQDSVSNWLNDAAKSQPGWAQELCRRWRRESRVAATQRICKRALRSL